MKKLIKEYWGFFSVLILINAFVILGSLIKVNYDITAPASITKVSNVIQIEKDDDSNVNTVSVYSYSKVSLLDYLFAMTNPYAEISETYEYSVTDLNVVYSSGIIQKRVSIYNSIIAAYTKSGYKEIINDDSYKGYIIHTLSTYAPSELKIGDIITKFNGINIEGFTGEDEFSKVINNIEYVKDKKYPITIIRNNQEYNYEISTKYGYEKNGIRYASFGISAYEYIVPNHIETLPSYKWNYGDSIGPSGGLMQSLHIYDSLNGGRITKNLKIVGTGTVDAYGNAGPIGGIYQKVITAHLSNADLFIIPVSTMDKTIYQNESNYKEAMKAYNTIKNPKMKIIVASSLDDIIEYLNK